MKKVLKSKRFWLTVASGVTAISYFVTGDILGGVKVVGTILMGGQ